MKYPSDIDSEMIPLLDELNSLPGVRTKFSCCGHCRKSNEFYIVLFCDNIKSLKIISQVFKRIDVDINEDLSSHYVVTTNFEIDSTPKDSICVRISAEKFNYLRKPSRIKQYQILINNIRNYYAR